MLLLFLFVCVFMCMLSVYLYVCICMHACESGRPCMMSVHLCTCIAYICIYIWPPMCHDICVEVRRFLISVLLETGYLAICSCIYQSFWPMNFYGFSSYCLLFHNRNTGLYIYERSRYLELDSHACRTNTLPTEPFFQPRSVFFVSFCFSLIVKKHFPKNME